MASPAGVKKRSANEMPLSCQRCRLRKIKCNFAHPCSACVKFGVDCVVVSNDLRKKRPPANYVLTLEKQIDSCLKFLSQLVRLETPEARSQFLDNNSAAIAALMSDSVPASAEEPDLPLPMDEAPKSRSVYGPTSVFHSEPEQKPHALSLKLEVRETAALKELAADPDVHHCLRLFFTWQYPQHNMFVFREAFFQDFLRPKGKPLYCSLALVLSICALGARMLDVDTIYTRSLTYYNKARSSLLSNLGHPSITSVQSFLLLAFYDICNGHNSTGWMLSGSAMRMGTDLGFQLNPQVWFLKQSGALKDLDLAIRSRIYWGCFMADHFISLVLGRPSLLKLLDASIPETEDLPELDWIDAYKYIPETATNILDPLKNIIKLISISDNMLSDIFTKTDEPGEAPAPPRDHDLRVQAQNSELLRDEAHADDAEYDPMSRISQLYDYNAQILEWKQNLPKEFTWDREVLGTTADNPTISSVRYYYYILILCLNRPFVGLVMNDEKHTSPSRVCAEAIEDLYIAIHKFESSHGLRRASIFIVYCSILSISVILLTSTDTTLAAPQKEKLQYFMQVLAGCSKTWRLAEKSHKMIQAKLMVQFVDDVDFQAFSKRAKRQKRSLVKEEPLNVPEPIATVLGEPELPYDDVNAVFDQINVEDPSTEFFGGPPVLMTSDLFNEDWEALFPDLILHQKAS